MSDDSNPAQEKKPDFWSKVAAAAKVAKDKVVSGVVSGATYAKDAIANKAAVVGDKFQAGKRYVAQGVNHTMDDRTCTFASKSNPSNPSAYRDCVETMAYNRYARDCKETMAKTDLSDEEKKRKCSKYRWEYLMESMPMLQVPDREEEPELWKGLDDQQMLLYDPVTYKFDGKGSENYRTIVKRGSAAARRGSARRRGSCRGSSASSAVARRGSSRGSSASSAVARRGSSRGSSAARRGSRRGAATCARGSSRRRGSARRH